MSPRFRELGVAAQTAFAELLESARVVEMARTVGSLNGSFATKTVRSKRYWYFAYRDLDGRTRQLYVGPDNPDVRRLVESAEELRPTDLRPQARSAHALGCATVVPRHFRIIRRLAEYGFFRAGGVLIGTHAFVAAGNTLGVAFTDASRTLDLDFAHAGRNVSVALPATIRVEVRRTSDSLQLGLLPLTELDGKASATLAAPKEPELRIDFLTSAPRASSAPVFVENLGIPLQPMKYLELILESPDQTIVFCDEGAVVVNVPSAARMAIHKLIVSTLRAGPQQTKAGKDLSQAAALIEALARARGDDLEEVAADARGRGPSWRKHLDQGARLLEKLRPEVAGLEHLR